MSVGFLYQSAKDTLKGAKLDFLEHIKTVMTIGDLIHMDTERFNEFKMNASTNTVAMTGDDIDRLAQAQNMKG